MQRLATRAPYDNVSSALGRAAEPGSEHLRSSRCLLDRRDQLVNGRLGSRGASDHDDIVPCPKVGEHPAHCLAQSPLDSISHDGLSDASADDDADARCTHLTRSYREDQERVRPGTTFAPHPLKISVSP